MKLIDQPATLEWFPALMQTARRGEKITPQPQRRDFETVAAATLLVRTDLSELNMPEITTSDGITLRWGDIMGIARGLP